MFLTETSTRHSLLKKHKHFRAKGPGLMQSNTSKLIAETNANPVDVDTYDPAPIRIEDDEDDDAVNLADIPVARTRQRTKRRRSRLVTDDDDVTEASGEDDAVSAIGVDSDADQPQAKRLREEKAAANHDDGNDDDKKKLAMDVTYEGFAIYGRVLCLVVKKKESNRPLQASHGDRDIGGQARMENWITSTQMPVGEDAT